MAEAASLYVAIEGDASGLLSAVNEAKSGLAELEGSAEKISALENKKVSLKISALDDTASGVRSAQRQLDSLRDKTVTISVNYKALNPFSFANGTNNAPGGLAVINDERGISDPRELIYHNGKYMMFSGRDVVVPLSDGDKVYTAEQTKKILKNIPHYARGRNNEMFEEDKLMFESSKKTGHITYSEQLSWWREIMQKYAWDSNVVRECNEEIFSLTRKLAESINNLSEIYVSERAYFNDFESYGDTALEAFERVRERNYNDMQNGTITWEEYCKNLSDIGSAMYNERLACSKRWLEQESKYNNMSAEDYIAGLERMKVYTREYYENGIISYKEYTENIQALSNSIADKTAAMHSAVYNKWVTDAGKWKKLRDTYDDWEEFGDSEVKFYERCIQRVDEMYRAGHISWQKYSDDTMNYEMELYKARMSEAGELLTAQSSYISGLKSKFSNEEKALKEGWSAQDRAEDISEVKKQLAIYKNAVTEKGKDKYAELQKQLKSLEREERIYQLEKSNNAVISKLESEYKIMEDNKKILLSSLQSSGINVQGLVRGINTNVNGVQRVMSELADKIIRAINGKSTYSDNRSFSISAADSSVLNNFAKSVESAIARGRYY